MLRNGHWANDDTDSGLVWVDKNGMMWTDHNGHPLTFTFAEALSGEHHELFPVPKNPANVTPGQEQEADTGIAPNQYIPPLPEDKKQKSVLKAAAGGKL